jgi:agmatine deiminase
MRALILLSLTLVLISCNNKELITDFYMPAEFELQEAVYVGWFNNPKKDGVAAEIVSALYNSVQVKIFYSKESMKYNANLLLSGYGVDSNKINWIRDSLRYDFPRDPGPIFLLNNSGEMKIADFNWNTYGYEYVYKDFRLNNFDSLYGEIEKREAARLGIDVLSSEIVNEGGAFEVNGNGVMMAIEETALQRNPDKSISEIEKEYLRLTGSKKMIWLKRAVIHDRAFDGPAVENWFTGGANGHMDEMARFVSDNTILLAQISEEERSSNPISKVDYEILEENFKILQRATDINEKPFQIIRVPSPNLNVPDYFTEIIVSDEWRANGSLNMISFANGDTIRITKAVSYMNFFISNEVVLSAKYWKEGMPESERKKDEEVKKILQQVFSERKIIQINPLAINRGGGGIHCATQQQPKRKLLE